jgi:chromate transporter
MTLLQLFLSFLQISAFSFGGGYAALPLIQNQVVTLHGWMTLDEFTDLITISQMTPGPIAINSATFVGLKIYGIPGAIAATLGCILPSCIIVSILAYAYIRFQKMNMMQKVLETLRPAVVAMIGGAGLSILVTAFWGNKGIIDLAATKIDAVLIFIGAFYFIQRKKVNPILVMVLAGAVKVLISFVKL